MSATINLKNKDDKSFQHAVTAALNYGEIESNPKRVLKKWKGINYPSKIDDWKMLEKNKPAIALKTLYINEKEICPVYISKIDSNCEKQINLIIFPNEEKEGWHYLAVKNYLRY